MKLVVFALVALALAGCVAGPDFVRPKPPATDRYTAEPLPDVPMKTQAAPAKPGPAAPAAVPAQDWWTVFGSADLDATVKAALAGNRDLDAARASLAQAQALYGASRSARLPELTGTAGAGRNKYGAAFLGGFHLPPFTYYSIGTKVSYLLDFAGGVHRSIEARQALAEVKRHEVDAADLSLTGNVVLQSVAIASARAQIAAVQAVIDEDTRNVELVRKALQEGSVGRVDLLSAESQLAQDQTLLPPLHQSLSVARHALAVLVGQPPANWSAPDFDLDDFMLPGTLPVSLPSALAHRRPDILAGEAQLHAATAAIGVAAAKLYPSIALTSSLSQQALSPKDLFQYTANAWGIAGDLTAPIFNGGKLRAQRRAAEDAARAALAKYEQTVLTAFGQVADVLASLQHDAEQAAAQQRALQVAQSSLALTRESYAAGNVGVLQVLDAERLAQRARIGVARVRAARMRDTAELIVALGGDAPKT